MQSAVGAGAWQESPNLDLGSTLLLCVIENMTGAAFHWLEYLNTCDRESARVAYAVKMLRVGPVVDLPRPRDAAEQLAPAFIRMHQAAIIRAIASALDCLADLIIGLAALHRSILKAGFNEARKVMASADVTAGSGPKAQADFAALPESAAGPRGSLDWTLDL